MSAAWESLHAAAQELASQDHIKQRLTVAFSKHLCEMDQSELPSALRLEYQSLAARMTCVKPLRGESAVAATVRKMSNAEAGECARRIVGLLKAFLPSSALAMRTRPVVSLYTADA